MFGGFVINYDRWGSESSLRCFINLTATEKDNAIGEAFLKSTHNLCFEQKSEKNIGVFYLKIFSFWR